MYLGPQGYTILLGSWCFEGFPTMKVHRCAMDLMGFCILSQARKEGVVDHKFPDL